MTIKHLKTVILISITTAMLVSAIFHITVKGQEGKKYFFEIDFMGGPATIDETTIMADGWEQIGIKVNMLTPDWATKYSRYTFREVFPGATYKEGGNDICTSGWPSPADPDTFNYYHTEAQTGRSAANSNSMMYSNGEVDRLLELGTRTVDLEERQAIYRRIEEIIHEELPVIYTYRDPAIKATTSNLDLGPSRGLPASGLFDYAENFKFTDKTGGTMIFIGNEDVTNLNPAFTTSTVVVNNIRLIHRRLLRDGLVYGTFAPDLAADYNVSSDGLVYTFYLRDDVKWHDGAPFTADDVIFTWNLYKTPDAGFVGSGLWVKYIQDIIKVDDYTVQFVLTELYAPALMRFANMPCVLPKHILGDVAPADLRTHPYNKNPIGTGPFKFVEWKPDEYIRYEAFSDFYLGKPALDGITFRPLPDHATGIAALEAGEIHLIEQQAYRVAIIKGYSRLKDISSLEISIDPCNGVNLLILNLNHPVLNNVNVRKAMAMSLNIQAIIDGPMYGLANPTPQRYPSIQSEFYNPNITHYPYDIEGAKELMMKAGYNYDLLKTPETTTTDYALPAIGGLLLGALIGILIDRKLLTQA